MLLSTSQVSSVELERVVLEAVPGVAEAAAVGIPTPGGGPEQLCLFIVLGAATSANTAVSKERLVEVKTLCNQAIKTKLNPLFKVRPTLKPARVKYCGTLSVMHELIPEWAVCPTA